MSRRDAEDILTSLRRLGQESLGSALGEIFNSPAMKRQLDRTARRLSARKEQLSENLETALRFLNLPSARDIRELNSRLDQLAGQILNLNIKFDRLAAELRESAAQKPRPQARRRSPRKDHPPDDGP